MTFPPDFKLPIEDRHAAEWWLDEWWSAYRTSKDEAFRDAARAMQRYIDINFDDVGDEE